MQIWQNGSRPSGTGPSEWFTGKVRIDPVIAAQEPSRAHVGHVTFEPCARTAWHTHPVGQVLIITSGKGIVQSWGMEARPVGPGDVIHFAANEKHWHGASRDTAMSHLAIHESLEGKVVDWMEQVSDADFQTANTPHKA